MLLNPNFRLCCTQSLHSSCFCVYLLRCSLFNWMYMCFFFFWSKYTPCHFHYLECGYKMFLHCVYSLCSHNVNRTCTQSSIYNCTTRFESSFPFLSGVHLLLEMIVAEQRILLPWAVSESLPVWTVTVAVELGAEANVTQISATPTNSANAVPCPTTSIPECMYVNGVG